MRHIHLTLLLVILTAHTHAQLPGAASPIFQIGEELQYAVRWRSIRLGTITVRTSADSADTAASRLRCVMDVESSPYLPFISLQEHNEAVMDVSRLRSLSYAVTHLLNGDRQVLHHTFEPQNRTVTTEIIEGEHERIVRKTIADIDWYVEGTSLFFYVRDAARKGGTYEIPTLVNQEIARTTISVTGAPEDLIIEVWDSPIRTHRFVGTAEWSGGSAAGVTGDFTGWVSDDDASVVLRAEVEIFLGSIDIELEYWKRKEWSPPSTISAAQG